jgi:mono/diheme cytochrome c family protein
MEASMTNVVRRRSAVAAIALAAFAVAGASTLASAQSTTPPSRAAAPTAPTGQAAPTTPPGRADAGAAVYRKVGCYQCHVNEAQGGANGPKLGPDPVPFARFTQYVRKPTGDMPPYSEKVLTAQDLADIYAFLRARPRPPAVNTIPLLAP